MIYLVFVDDVIESPLLRQIENQLELLNEGPYQLDENYDVTSNFGLEGYAIIEAENLAYSIAFDVLESLVN